jgi:cbb3-type cytochrome oxidase cytochrome c subunit
MRNISRLVRVSGLIAFASMMAASVVTAELQKKPKAAPKPDPKLIAAGIKVYKANNCAACHLIKDQGGKTGPDLTHIAKGKTDKWMGEKIRDPKKATPGSAMPAYNEEAINAKELKSLVAYLMSLK